MKRIQLFISSLLLALSMPAMAQTTLIGDVNGDGTVNITDLNVVIGIIIDGKEITAQADVNGDGNVNISDVNAIISIILDGPPAPPQHEYVDLGLPSGTLWATCNVGASRPEEYGDYFAWGETAPKEIYNYDSYKWPEYSKYNERDSLTELEPEDDAAFVNWGSSWRMPSDEQYDELFNSCSWQWTQQNGVNGVLLTSPNGNTLFLPAAGERWFDDLGGDGTIGQYWTRIRYAVGSPGLSSTASTVLLEFTEEYWFTGWRPVRDSGRSVRAVRVSPDEAPSLYIVQQSLDLGDVLIGETRTGNLTIVNNTTESLTLTATVDEPFSLQQQEGSVTSMTIVVPANSRDTVTVMFTAVTTGDYSGNVTFQCPALEGGQSIIPVHALAFNPLEDYIDLGLPSGTLWATCNVGATRPEDYGDYFAWGETAPKEAYTWETYKWCNGSANTLTKYCTDSAFGTVDNKTELEPADDAAHVNWGKLWSMPTLEQQQELISECTWEWTTSKGVNGYQVTGPNGNSMFLPAAGYRNDSDSEPIFVGSYGDYWTSTLNAAYPGYARDQYFYSTGAHWGISSRNLGLTVRAVRAPADLYIVQKSLDLGEVPVGETREGELTIVNNTTESVILTATVHEPFSFKQEDGSASTMTITVPGNSRDTVTVMFTATAPVTHAQGRVTFQCSALEGGQCVIPVQAVVIYTSDYVDLGLPSGTLWATRNIGANSPEEYGDYFAWGETAPKEVYTVQTYKWGGYDSDGQFYLTKYNSNSWYGTIDNKNELDPEDDAAYVNWGASWRIPTPEQLHELITNCSWKWTQSNGVNGKLFTGPNGNTLFLPAAGYYSSGNSFLGEGTIGEYWSRMLNPSDDINARGLGFSETDINYGATLRTHGLTIRPVRALQD